MNIISRIKSIVQATQLDHSIIGLPTFDLSTLRLETELEFELPTKLRLGHLVEKIVSELIKSSSNYNILYENIQIINDKRTIGELDFILEEIDSKQIIHMELAYKFYLFDPSISSDPTNNWIGPNRNDSLIEKLRKLEYKQFPLLYHECTQLLLKNIEIENVLQKLCFIVSLYIPYSYKKSLHPVYEKAIKGYYINFETLKGFNHFENLYYIPSKTEWGINPSTNEDWSEFKDLEKSINTRILENQSLLCWQKCQHNYSSFFIIWW